MDHIMIERIIVVKNHFTIYNKKKKNKQTNKQKEKKKTSLC